MNFYDGKGKLFYNTEKKFSTYLSIISNFERFDLSKLDGLDKEYQTVLKKYQQFTDMSDDRIEKLVDGIRIRIKEFNTYKEKANFQWKKYCCRERLDSLIYNKDVKLKSGIYVFS